MLDPELVEILVCPETKQPVAPAEAALVERVNAAIAEGRVRNQDGTAIREGIEGGLVREDGRVMYPVRDDIPVMLIDEAIPLEGLD